MVSSIVGASVRVIGGRNAIPSIVQTYSPTTSRLVLEKQNLKAGLGYLKKSGESIRLRV